MDEQSHSNAIDESPYLLYEDANGTIRLCSLYMAQKWMRSGYLTSEMKWAYVPREEEEENGEEEVWTLNALIERNGASMPFAMYGAERRRNEVDTIRLMNEELLLLFQRKSTLLASIQSLKNRLATAQSEMKDIEERNNLSQLSSLPSPSMVAPVEDHIDVDSLPPLQSSRPSLSTDTHSEDDYLNIMPTSTPTEDQVVFESDGVVEAAIERLKLLGDWNCHCLQCSYYFPSSS